MYDNIAKYYDPLIEPLEKLFLAEFRREALSHIPGGSFTLEIGSGTGRNFACYGEFRDPVALDISLAMLKQAQTKSSAVALLQSDAQSLPFGDSTFDAAIGTLVFCSIPDPASAFTEIVRVVRPGGKVVLLEHVRPDGMLGNCFDLLDVATTFLIDDHFNRRTSTMAKECGLEIVDVRTRYAGILNLIIARTPLGPQC
jgi:ubiquinone/menaquinone biosynthesis C-methylase UbiE